MHRPFRLRRARGCPHTQSRCTGPSRSGVPAGARKCNSCHRSSGPCCGTYHRGLICQASQVQQMPQVLSPYCSTDRRGSCARRPRFSRCRRFSSGQVPIAAQTTVGLVPGVRVDPKLLPKTSSEGPDVIRTRTVAGTFARRPRRDDRICCFSPTRRPRGG